MNTTINYLLEANLGLCLFLLVYILFLRNETDFRLKRVYMLLAVIASVVLPLFHFNTTSNVLPSLGDFVPPTWLPEVVVEANGTASNQETTLNFNAWSLTNIIYSAGVVLSLMLFLSRLGMLLKMIYKATTFKHDSFLIAESTENKSAFSFFQFIFIGQANQLSQEEKQQIIDHERVHVQQLHSVDILLMNVLNIFFWFNPVVKMYKKIFIQLHEFEADARAVENRDVNDYCTLLAKVALLSADYTIANHFSNSLTLKRIEMMRTIKSKIRGWKIMTILLLLPAFFFVVSCQDQLADVTEIAKNSTAALVVPENVQARYDQLKKENPNSNYILVEFNEKAQHKLAEMEKLYGNPSQMELFTPDGKSLTNWGNVSVSTDKDAVIEVATKESDDLKTYAIIKYDETMAQISESSKQEGDIFTIVEEMAYPVGGIENIGTFLGRNINYPEESRKANKEGTVFVQFVVNTDGSLTNFKIVKGVDPLIDAEAIRVAKLFPHWNPGKQGGKAVRQQFILPIRFKLNETASAASVSALQIRAVDSEFNIEFTTIEEGDKKVITGKVKDENGIAMRGANILNVGSTSGTTTDANGNFKLVVPKTNGELAVSFIGYKTEVIKF